MDKDKGFTLIELLVVVSIIGMLSSVVLASLNGARVKARDAKRLSDLRQIGLALEFYYSDFGNYPAGERFESVPGFNWDTLETALQPYISPLPIDPVNVRGGPWIRYTYDSDLGDNYQTYWLGGVLESPSNTSILENDGGFYPTVYEPGNQSAYCVARYGLGDPPGEQTDPGNPWAGGDDVCLGGN